MADGVTVTVALAAVTVTGAAVGGDEDEQAVSGRIKRAATTVDAKRMSDSVPHDPSRYAPFMPLSVRGDPSTTSARVAVDCVVSLRREAAVPIRTDGQLRRQGRP